MEKSLTFSHDNLRSSSRARTQEFMTQKLSQKNDDEGLDIEFVLEKYDDLLAASQKLSKQNAELIKTVAVLKLKKGRIADELPSSDTAPRMRKNELTNIC
ncbi:uncharacterized protein Pyn_18270 [Prunus yedoensis var. nudiflora]|uniref:Uncharacterized protein n=1 Tax=Prunus yedoensis var. nudiflora TaxID=2094558 RepID=A0A314YK45_PRUYE|nr:uncharacterized protein Pyn_18270 [Prunus yedoensis var. nudiflora]